MKHKGCRGSGGGELVQKEWWRKPTRIDEIGTVCVVEGDLVRHVYYECDGCGMRFSPQEVREMEVQ